MRCFYNSVVLHGPFQNISANYFPYSDTDSKYRREKYNDARLGLKRTRRESKSVRKQGWMSRPAESRLASKSYYVRDGINTKTNDATSEH